MKSGKLKNFGEKYTERKLTSTACATRAKNWTCSDVGH